MILNIANITLVAAWDFKWTVVWTVDVQVSIVWSLGGLVSY